MKISKREKILIVFLVFILLVGGYYKLVFKKETNRIDTLKADRKEYSGKIVNIKSKITLGDKRASDFKTLNSKVQDRASSIYPSIMQDKMIIELDDLLKKSNVVGNFNFSFGNNVANTSDKTSNSSSNTNSSGASSTTDNSKLLPDLQSVVNEYNASIGNKTTTSANNTKGVYKYMQVTLTFKGSYSNVMSLIKNIESNNKKIAITNISITGNNTEVSGTATLDLYSIPKLAGMDEDYFKWNYNNTYGKENPFPVPEIAAPADTNPTITVKNSTTTVNNTTVANNTANAKTTTEDSTEMKLEFNDIGMQVKPLNSDIPTIAMALVNDEEGKSEIDYDNNNVGQVEISLIEANGKFYIKYKIGDSSYPSNYSGNGEEFTPNNDDIRLAIMSSQRLNDKDLSGANIKIINKTSKIVNVFIIKDDTSKPRVSVNGEGNAVKVHRQ